MHFTLPVHKPECSLCVVCLNMAAVAGKLWSSSCRYYGSWGKKEDFSLPGSSGPEGLHAQAKRKLIGYTYLVCLCLLDLFFSRLPSIEGIDFPLSLISTVERHEGGE